MPSFKEALPLPFLVSPTELLPVAEDESALSVELTSVFSGLSSFS